MEPAGRPRSSWENNIKTDIQVGGCIAGRGLILLRVGTDGGLLWMRQWTFGSHKVRGSLWLAENRLDSQEGLCCTAVLTDSSRIVITSRYGSSWWINFWLMYLSISCRMFRRHLPLWCCLSRRSKVASADMKYVKCSPLEIARKWQFYVILLNTDKPSLTSLTSGEVKAKFRTFYCDKYKTAI